MSTEQPVQSATHHNSQDKPPHSVTPEIGLNSLFPRRREQAAPEIVIDLEKYSSVNSTHRKLSDEEGILLKKSSSAALNQEDRLCLSSDSDMLMLERNAKGLGGLREVLTLSSPQRLLSPESNIVNRINLKGQETSEYNGEQEAVIPEESDSEPEKSMQFTDRLREIEDDDHLPVPEGRNSEQRDSPVNSDQDVNLNASPMQVEEQENNIIHIQPRASVINIDEAEIEAIQRNLNELSSQINHNVSVMPQPAAARDLQRYWPYARPEANLYVIAVLMAVLTAFICSVLVLVELEFDNVLIAILIFGVFTIILMIFKKSEILGNIPVSSSSNMQAWDWSMGLLVLVGIHFRIVNLLPTTMFMPVLFFGPGVYCLCAARNRLKKERWDIFPRFIYGFQTVFICIKMDELIDWSWHFVLIFFWIYLIAALVYRATFSYTLYRKMKQISVPDMTRSKKNIGLAWHIFVYILIVLALFTVAGTGDALDQDQTTDFLKIVSIASLALNGFLFFSLIAFRKKLVDFIVSYGLIESIRVNYYASRPKKAVKTVTFETESKDAYFVMVSSTYFLPLNKSFSLADKESLKQLKTGLERIKMKRNSHLTPGTIRASEAKDLMQDKRDIQKLLDQVAIGNQDGSIRNKERKIAGTYNNLNAVDSKDSYGDIIERKRGVKRTMSFGNNNKDYEIYRKDEVRKRITDEEKTCHLCCTNLPDAILMNCGHGGICHDCAVTLVKKKNECLECRGKVEGIYRIDPNPVLSDIVKGTALSRIVIKLV